MSEEETSIASVDARNEAERARDEVWEGVVMPALQGAVAVAWDTCHKVYVLKDDEQLRVTRELGYPLIVERATESPAEDADEALLETIKDWFSRSCPLRFVQAVATGIDGDPNDGFETLIEQAHPAFED